jgi:signal transduction histidine kinase
MNIIFIISLIVGIVCSLLGVAVYIKQQSSNLSYIKYFALACISTTIWVFANIALPIFNDANTSLLVARFSFSSASIMLGLTFMFIVEFPNSNKRRSKYLIFLPTLIIVVLSWTELITKGIDRNADGVNNVVYGAAYPLYVIYILVLFIFTIIYLSQKIKRLSGQEKLQAKYFFFGITLSGISMLITNLAIPVIFQTSFFSKYGPVFMIFFLSFTSLAIIKHRLFGLSFIIGRIIHFMSLALIGFLAFYIVLNIQLYLWKDVFSTGAYITGGIFAVVFTIVYWQLYKIINKYVDRNIVNFQYSPEEQIGKFAEKVSTSLEVNEIQTALTDILSTNLQLNNIAVNLLDKEDKLFVSSNVKLTSNEIVNIFHYWAATQNFRILIKNEIENTNHLDENPSLKEIYNVMVKNSIEIIFPFSDSKQFSGLLYIGLKKDNEGYTAEDIEFINKIIETASAAFSRALLYTEVQKFNDTLQDKIKIATKEIQEQKQQIEDAYKAERDRMNILSHELRTPLSTARNAVSMLKMYFDSGKFSTDKEAVNKGFSLVMENLRREIVLLERIFTVSQIRAGTITTRREKVNCNEVVAKALTDFRHIADKKGVQVIVNLPQTPIEITSDLAKVNEIIGNIFENSAKYTNQGSITISLEDLGDKVKFTVVDTGIGIPKEEIPKLGQQEYYKINTYLQSSLKNTSMPLTRPDGTGLGMFVIRNLTKLLNAELVIESEEGKGTKVEVIFGKILYNQ